jgi:hypothetical protein
MVGLGCLAVGCVVVVPAGAGSGGNQDIVQRGSAGIRMRGQNDQLVGRLIGVGIGNVVSTWLPGIGDGHRAGARRIVGHVGDFVVTQGVAPDSRDRNYDRSARVPSAHALPDFNAALKHCGIWLMACRFGWIGRRRASGGCLSVAFARHF